MKKIFLLISINISILIILLLMVEVFTWGFENYLMMKNKEVYIGKWPIPFHSGEKYFDIDLKYFPAPQNKWGREPEGLNSKKPPVVIFGCSYAYGFELDKEQTVSYKLAHAANRPVYNRAVTGWGIQHMLYQTKIPLFYEQVPEPEYAIFIMMYDHFRRLYCKSFSSGHLLYEERYLRYKDKDGILTEIGKPKIKNAADFIRYLKNRLYITNKLRTIYLNKVILNPKNHNEYFNFAIKHFVQSRAEMQKHWKNTKYVILLYDNIDNQDLFVKSLQENGFTVISLPELTNTDLNSSKYKLPDDSHPNGAAWDLTVPLLVKELKL